MKPLTQFAQHSRWYLRGHTAEEVKGQEIAADRAGQALRPAGVHAGMAKAPGVVTNGLLYAVRPPLLHVFVIKNRLKLQRVKVVNAQKQATRKDSS